MEEEKTPTFNQAHAGSITSIQFRWSDLTYSMRIEVNNLQIEQPVVHIEPSRFDRIYNGDSRFNADFFIDELRKKFSSGPPVKMIMRYYDKHAGHGIHFKDKLYFVIKASDIVLVD